MSVLMEKLASRQRTLDILLEQLLRLHKNEMFTPNRVEILGVVMDIGDFAVFIPPEDADGAIGKPLSSLDWCIAHIERKE